MALEIDFSKPIDISKLKTAEDIKKVQQFLLDQNEPGGPQYNLGTTGDNKNGVDGALGSRTKKAIEQYNTWLAGENAKRAAAEQKKITPVSTINTGATSIPTQATPVANTTKKEVVITSAPTTPVEAAPQPPKEQKVVELPSSVEAVPTTNVPAKNTSSVEAPIDMQGTYVDPKVAEEIIKKSKEEGLEVAPAVVQPDTFDPMAYREAMRLQKASARRTLENDTSKGGEGEDTTETTTTENPTATQTFNQAMADRSYIQSLFDERRKAAERERTDQLALASYNSLGNALRSLAQPLGWWGSTANVQPYDRRAYLDAFNRAVAASNDLRNINDKEAEYYLNRAEWDRRQAQTLDDYEKKKEIEKQTQLAIIQARSDAAIKTLKEKVAQGGGKNLYADRLTSAVQGWIIHGGETPLMDYLDSIERATPGYFGKERPSAKVVREIEKAANDAGEATTQTGAQPAVTSTQGTSTQKNKAVAQSGLTEDERAIINKWKSVDTNNDGRIDSNERKVAKSNGLASPSKKEARRYEKASTKKAGLTTSNGATSARSIMGQNK